MDRFSHVFTTTVCFYALCYYRSDYVLEKPCFQLSCVMLRMVLNPIVYPVRSVHSLGATIGPTQPSVKLSTVGGLVVLVAGATIRNSLPDNVISVPSLSTFCQHARGARGLGDVPPAGMQGQSPCWGLGALRSPAMDLPLVGGEN